MTEFLITNTQLFLLVDYCDVFISCSDSFWWHPFTAEDEQMMQCYIWRNKLVYISDGLRVSQFSANLNFWANYSFNSYELLWISLRFMASLKPVWFSRWSLWDFIVFGSDSHKHKDKHKDREHNHKEHKRDKERETQRTQQVILYILQLFDIFLRFVNIITPRTLTSALYPALAYWSAVRVCSPARFSGISRHQRFIYLVS